MNERAPIFSTEDDDIDVADFRPATSPKRLAPEVLEQVRQTAERRGFANRDPASHAPAPPAALPPVAARPERLSLRRKRTGRDKQLNIKTTEQALGRFYTIVDAHGWGVGETFEKAIAALEAELARSSVS
jgi:hypothetical protein